ncbi:MAG: hypothetical protein MHM6MM_008144, partial [Cercozoa sp. M6MM]
VRVSPSAASFLSTLFEHCKQTGLGACEEWEFLHFLSVSCKHIDQLFQGQLAQLLGNEENCAKAFGNFCIRRCVANFEVSRPRRVLRKCTGLLLTLLDNYTLRKNMVSNQQLQGAICALPCALFAPCQQDMFRIAGNVVSHPANLHTLFDTVMQRIDPRSDMIRERAAELGDCEGEAAKQACTLLQDLEAFASHCRTRPSFLRFWAFLTPWQRSLPLLVASSASHLNTAAAQQQVQCATSFVGELVLDRQNRVIFGDSSDESFRLFSLVSRMLQILHQRGKYENEDWAEISACLLKRALSARLAHAGAYRFFNDATFDTVLKTILQSTLAALDADIGVYATQGKSVIVDTPVSRGAATKELLALIEVLLRNHASTVLSSLDEKSLLCLCAALLDGVQHSDGQCAAAAANALFNFSTFLCNQMEEQRRKAARGLQPQSQVVDQVISVLTRHCPSYFPLGSVILVTRVVFDGSTRSFALSRPLLPLLLLSASFGQQLLHEVLLAAQPPPLKQRMQEALAELLEGVPPTLSTAAQDRFTKNFAAFSSDVKVWAARPPGL